MNQTCDPSLPSEKPEASPEENIRSCLERMRRALNGQTPHFKEYWEAKGQCLPFFKESLAAPIRAQLWGEYIALSSEARHLKEVLDEQSAFAIEQIDLAIQAIDEDLEKMEERVAAGPEIDFPLLDNKREFYTSLQKQLNFLNMSAVKVTALRKEIIKTEMRIRIKNKLLDRLSLCGDKIFPKRKELILQISSEFLADVMEFSKVEFGNQDLRGDIKDFQLMAKGLSLDTQTFTQTRLELSRLWDLFKEKEVLQRQEFAEKKDVHQKNRALIQDKINLFAERCQKDTVLPEEASKQTKDILSLMKTVELGREDIAFLKDEITKARSPVDQRVAKKQEEREREVEISQKLRQEKVEQFRLQVKEVSDKICELSVEELTQQREGLQRKLQLLVLTQAQRELLEHELKIFRDLIIDKREKAISTLTSEQKQSLDHQYALLKDYKEQKNEVRNQLEVYRKDLAGSGFDFEKAMRLKELVDAEKNRLDKINEAIKEIEKQIDHLEGA